MVTKQTVTINDVARRAKVSVSTVSNVLTGNRPVADETRDRVLAIVAELGFRPNRLARGLVNRSSKTIGVVASGLDYYGPSRTLVGMEQEASDRGYTLILSLVHEPASVHVETVIANLLTHQVDGVIWSIPQIGDNRIWWDQMQTSLPVPIVFLDTHPSVAVATVSIDNHLGGYLATNHLLVNGFQYIGHITGPPAWLASEERKKGCEQALRQAGSTLEAHQVAIGDWSPQSGENALYELARSYPEMDAVFVSNDQMAIGAIRAASDLNIRIPEDIAIVGYDDIPEAAFTRPRLTTVRQQVIEIGRRAVVELLHMIALLEDQTKPTVQQAPSTILLQPSLIVRESSRSTN